jgi:hypothetical protein
MIDLEYITTKQEELLAWSRKFSIFPYPFVTHKKNKILIEFFALRDINGKYLGRMECSQDIQEIMGLTGSKVLMDEGE